jgi:hypothetical protein
MKKHTAALAIVLACGPMHAAAPTQQPITRATFNGTWPFTVEAGVIGCERGQAIKFIADKKTYAVNGTAKSWSQQAGFGWRDAREIWLDDPGNPGAKVPMTDVIKKGQTLCRPWS